MSVQPAGPQRLVIGISGASGVLMGVRLLELLRTTAIETHLVLSRAAQINLAVETSYTLEEVYRLATVHYANQNVGAAIASGSYPTSGMIVIPCSIKTLSAIANSYAADLLTRAADVTLKEGRPLALVVRETPLHRGHIRLLDLAAQAGAIIFPPIPAFYTQSQTLADMLDQMLGRLLARVGIVNDFYQEWGGLEK